MAAALGADPTELPFPSRNRLYPGLTFQAEEAAPDRYLTAAPPSRSR